MMMMMMIVPGSVSPVKVDPEEQSEQNQREVQTWNLNCASSQSTEPSLSMSLLLPKTQVDKSEKSEMPTSNSSPQPQFYYWDSIRWVEYPKTTNTLLAEGFKRNLETLVLSAAENRLYKIDFKNKLQMNLKTGYIRSVAWDRSVTGSRELAGFEKPFERQELLPSDDCFMRQEKHDMKSAAITKRESAEPVMLPTYPFQSKAVETFAKLGEKVAVLVPGHTEFSAVNDVFNKGFSPSSTGKRPRLTAVHKVLNSDAKLRYFGEQVQIMERTRGNANLRHAWHGSSADAIVSIVMYGFGQRPMSVNGNNYGCGTYLAPCSKLDVSSQYSEVDDNMEQHALLCEVVLGESEVITPGSCHRFLPSSTSFDSGVDDIAKPNLYVVWTPFINSHIIPWYIVSFVTEKPPRKFSGPLRRSPDIIRSMPYSRQQPPIPEPRLVNDFFSPCGPMNHSKSRQLELLAQATRLEEMDNRLIDGSDACLLKALNSSKERIQQAARSIQARKFHNLDGRMSKEDTSRSGRINLNLGLNIDGFTYQSRQPKRLVPSPRHQ